MVTESTFTVRLDPWHPEAWSGEAQPAPQEDGSAVLSFSLETTPGQLLHELPPRFNALCSALGAVCSYYEELARLRAEGGA